LTFENLGPRYPELFKKPYLDALPASTLKELGIESPAQATTSGYTCVRPQAVSGHRVLPALWVAAADLPLVEEYIAQVEAVRRVTPPPKNAADAKADKERKNNTVQALREFISLTGLSDTMVREGLPADLLKAFAVDPKNAVKRFLAQTAPAWGNHPFNPDKGAYLADGFQVSIMSRQFCAALLNNEPAKYLQLLDKALARLQQAACEAIARWEPSRPQWFPSEQLGEWAAGAAKGCQAEHPLLSISEVRHMGGKTLRLEVLPNKHVEVRVTSLQVSELLWSQLETPLGDVFHSVMRNLRVSAAEEVQLGLAQFLQANPFSVECARNEFSTEEWQSTLTAAYSRALPPKFAVDKAVLGAQAQLANTLAVRHLELAAKRCRKELPSSLKDFYPLARSLRREITFVYGPTNSGKTYHALEALKKAKTGAYLGPLRLLALEVFERLNAAGVPTSLVTGEVVTQTPRAQHTAATIEMLNLGKPVDVAVIDEVQMLSDPDRGSAWLQAVLGAPANHVVLLGSASALPAVRMLAKVTGERLKEVKLERLNPLRATEHPIVLKNAPKGSALIVFSRQAALSLANHMRTKYDRKVSVVYGALSPEVRSEQARQFREGETDVLVSTDAIGMGLNLPVHTVVFTTTTKWNGEEEVRLDHSLTCQIAGRAGRFGLQEAGYVTATDKADLKYVRQMLERPIPLLTPPYWVGLSLEMADSISRHLDTQSLSQIIAFFQQSMRMEEWANPSCSQDQLFLAGLLDRYEMSLQHKLLLSNAPAADKGMLNPYFKSMVGCVVKDKPEDLQLFKENFRHMALVNMEATVKSVTLYCWMHYRFSELFPRIKEAQEMLSALNAAITKELSRTATRKCTECNKPVPWDHAFGKCESCFSSGRMFSKRYSETSE
jgi:ATP-dependent RNA helicase SUPV3L1/SUV3